MSALDDSSLLLHREGHAKRSRTERLPRYVRAILRSRAVGWTFVASMLVVWEIIARLVPMPSFPPLSILFAHGVDEVVSGDLTSALGLTLGRMMLGYTAAVIIGVSVGILIGASNFFRVLLEPVIELARPVPISAFIPLLILFFGIDLKMKVWVIFFAASFPIILNTQAGVLSVPPTLYKTAQTFRLTLWQHLTEITLPYAAPSIFVGLRLALATALIISVLAEMIAGNNGIGFYILQGQQTLTVRDIYVGIFVLGLVGYLFNFTCSLIEGRLLRWRHARS